MNKDMSAEDEIIWHTGMETHFSANGLPNLWAELTQPGGGSQLAAAFEAVVQALCRLNTEINGLVPSEVIGGSPVVSRRLCRAVAEVGSMCRQALKQIKSPELRALVDQELQRIEIGWIAVLDGDIDNIEEHIEGELSWER